MQNFLPAFFSVFCLMSLGVIGLATGLGLVDPILGLLGVISCAIGIYSAAGSIED